eukprot:364171-Chlamydomonas_euryale.AAC.2
MPHGRLCPVVPCHLDGVRLFGVQVWINSSFGPPCKGLQGIVCGCSLGLQGLWLNGGAPKGKA